MKSLDLLWWFDDLWWPKICTDYNTLQYDKTSHKLTLPVRHPFAKCPRSGAHRALWAVESDVQQLRDCQPWPGKVEILVKSEMKSDDKTDEIGYSFFPFYTHIDQFLNIC